MVKEEVIQKSKGRGEMRGRGGPQRGGRGGRGIYSHADSTKAVNSICTSPAYVGLEEVFV